MTESIKTKCPNCHSTYPVPSEQLHNDSAKARCPKCKTAFFINHHLIEAELTLQILSDEQDITAKSTNSNSHSSSNASLSQAQTTQATNTGDGVFDSITNELSHSAKHNSASTVNEADFTIESAFNNNQTSSNDLLGSVDDMSDWLAQQAAVINQEKIQQQAVSITEDDEQTTDSAPNEDWLDNNASANHNSSNPAVNNQELANDTLANIPVEDEGDKELNELLNNYGVQTEEAQKIINEEQLEKMRKRSMNNSLTSQQVALQKSPMAMLIWFIGCLLLMALLLAQYAIFNVNELVKKPSHRSKLESACKILSCSLPNADINSLAITHLKHRASQVSPASTNTDIMAAIVNNSNDAQLYPNLKVTIQGKEGKLGEFIATPKDYLSVEQDQLSASQAKLFMFTVNLNNAKVSTVKIEPFY